VKKSRKRFGNCLPQSSLDLPVLIDGKRERTQQAREVDDGGNPSCKRGDTVWQRSKAVNSQMGREKIEGDSIRLRPRRTRCREARTDNQLTLDCRTSTRGERVVLELVGGGAKKETWSACAEELAETKTGRLRIRAKKLKESRNPIPAIQEPKEKRGS